MHFMYSGCMELTRANQHVANQEGNSKSSGRTVFSQNQSFYRTITQEQRQEITTKSSMVSLMQQQLDQRLTLQSLEYMHYMLLQLTFKIHKEVNFWDWPLVIQHSKQVSHGFRSLFQLYLQPTLKRGNLQQKRKKTCENFITLWYHKQDFPSIEGCNREAYYQNPTKRLHPHSSIDMKGKQYTPSTHQLYLLKNFHFQVFILFFKREKKL